MSIEERAAAGRERLLELLGDDHQADTVAHWEQICPAFGGYVNEFVFGEIWNRPGLTLRERSLITIAITAALGRPRALELNVRMAQRAGASKEEVTETLLQVAAYAGFPACWEGLAVADKVYGTTDERPPEERAPEA